jgi:hypothetical protein
MKISGKVSHIKRMLSQKVWESRYRVTHSEEERIRIIREEHELLLSWIPNALTPQ